MSTVSIRQKILTSATLISVVVGFAVYCSMAFMPAPASAAILMIDTKQAADSDGNCGTADQTRVLLLTIDDAFSNHAGTTAPIAPCYYVTTVTDQSNQIEQDTSGNPIPVSSYSIGAPFQRAESSAIFISSADLFFSSGGRQNLIAKRE